jgi:hypothetical protein
VKKWQEDLTLGGLTAGAVALAFAAGLAVALALSATGAAIVWFLYNIVVVPCFSGLPAINFWAIWAILFLVRIVAFISKGK